MMLKNNKGFSLIEVLVTVGLIGILVGIAVPSYNKYKENTSVVAIKADMGNASKTYNAYSAVNANFCADWTQVGLAKDNGGTITTSFDSSTLYKKKGFIGFASGDVDCPEVNGKPLNYKSTAGDTTASSQSTCTNSGGIWTQPEGAATVGTCGTNSANTYGALPENCKVGVNSFKLGATTEVARVSSSDQKKMFVINEEGIVSENNTLNCN